MKIKCSLMSDFFQFGTDLGKDSEYGLRYVKSKDFVLNNIPAKYWGEWSFMTNLPHGRGVLHENKGRFTIGYFRNG